MKLNTPFTNYHLNRLGRDLKELIKYPFWKIHSKDKPDNHLYKRKRIRLLNKSRDYKVFIETGTFYGQMIFAVKNIFETIISVELFQDLYLLNHEIFKNSNKVKIFQGDSSSRLAEMIGSRKGGILFWLDGHYSGSGTGMGELTSPILKELKIIKDKKLEKSCILIDDIRLFNGSDGYPTLAEAILLLKEIDSSSDPYIDKDCLITYIY